jgi:hypothetical protein
MVKTITRITNTRQGSPARGMSGAALALLLIGLNLAIPSRLYRNSLQFVDCDLERSCLPVDVGVVLRLRPAPGGAVVSGTGGSVEAAAI